MRYILFVTLVIVGLFFPFQTTSEIREEIPYTTEIVKSDYLDMGDTEIRSEGRVGIQKVKISSSANMLTRILSSDSITHHRVSEKVITHSVDKIIRKGTRRYQYMACSDGGYMYYTDAQFTTSSTIGYTSRSVDACLDNGAGYKLYLSNSKPVDRQVDTYGSGAICRDGWRSYSTGRGTCSYHGGVAYWL